MKNHWLLFLVLFLAAGCSGEDVVKDEPKPQEKDLLTVSFEALESRLLIQDESLKWSADDQISVFSATGPVRFNMQEGVGQSKGSFSGFLPEAPIGVAFYPESSPLQLSGNLLTIQLSGKVAEVHHCHIPMWTKWSGNSVVLKHMTGLLAVNTDHIPSGYNQLVVSSSDVITGAFEADVTQDKPVLTATESNTSDSNKVLVIKGLSLSDTETNMYYLPLPVGTYASLQVAMSNGTDELVLKNWKDIEVKRAQVLHASYVCLIIEEKSPEDISVTLANDMEEDNENGALATGQPVLVDLVNEIIANENPLVVPHATNGQSSEVTLNFLVAPVTSEDNPLKIEQDKEAPVGQSNHHLTVSMPVDAQIKHMDIMAPATSVNLRGGQYEKLTATSATHTIIIGSDVIVEDLVVRDGNVRIENGGRITGTLTKSESCTSQVMVILEDGTDPSSALPAGFSTNDDFWVGYESEYQLLQSTASSTAISLTGNVELLNPLEVTHKIEVDLNGKTIRSLQSDLFVVRSGGELILLDTTDKGIAESAEGQNVLCLLGGTANIQSGTYIGKLSVDANTAKLNITGGVFQGFDPTAYVDTQFEVRLQEGTQNHYQVIPVDWLEVSDNIYEIYTAEGLRKFASMVNDGYAFTNATIRLGATIDLNHQPWTPIGSEELPFSGTFDGQGFAIKNIQINDNSKYVGLFSYAIAASIRNLRLNGGEIKGGQASAYVGGLIGCARGVHIINCHNEGCKIIHRYTKGTIGKAGGLAGHVGIYENQTSVVIACSNTADIQGAYCTSGIIGGGFGACTQIVACYNLGTITGEIKDRMFASGITADFGGMDRNFMYSCFSDCSITEGETNGALVGDIGSNAHNVHYSYSANSSMKLFGQIWSTQTPTVGYSSYRDAVPYLNKGIEIYNWTATIPCEYTFAEGDQPSLVYTKPSANSGMGGENWGNGGKY